MDSSSGMFVQLLSSASQYASHEFQCNALQMLRGVCEFDMAMWGVVSFARNARTIYHSINLHQVPLEVFKAIAPVALLLVEAPSITVHGRLASRAADPPSVETIERLAERERDRALETAKALNIPIWHAAGVRVADDEARTMVGRIRAVGGGA